MVIGENVLKLYIYPYCIQLVGYLGHNFDTGLGTKSKNCPIQENWLVYCQPVLVTALSLFVCLTAVFSIKMANCYSCLSWRQEYELSQMKTKVFFFFPLTGVGHSNQLHQSNDGSAGGEDGGWRRGKDSWEICEKEKNCKICIVYVKLLHLRLIFSPLKQVSW